MSDPWDDVACPHMAEWFESVSFPCGCGKTTIWLTDLEMSCAIDWLKNGPEKVPIYHMGMLGCCEDLRCTECDNMPSHCECEN